MTTVLETARLRLREWRDSEVDALAALYADEEQMRFYPRTRTREEAAEAIAFNRELYAKRGYGIWVVESLETSAFLGYCGIHPLVVDGVDEVEVGWHTHKAWWNQGIASEAAAASLELGFGRFGLDRLVATIDPDHAASRRVAEKIGMRLEKSTVLDDGFACVVYASP